MVYVVLRTTSFTWSCSHNHMSFSKLVILEFNPFGKSFLRFLLSHMFTDIWHFSSIHYLYKSILLQHCKAKKSFTSRIRGTQTERAIQLQAIRGQWHSHPSQSDQLPVGGLTACPISLEAHVIRRKSHLLSLPVLFLSCLPFAHLLPITCPSLAFY